MIVFDFSISSFFTYSGNFKEPENKTLFPVYLPSKYTGEQIIVYYAKDNFKRDRFLSTKKYEYAFKTGDWGFE